MRTTYYRPHYAVIKESSASTKTRAVFDASAKTTSFESLNVQLMTRPTIQYELMSIFIRWRKFKIAFTADV